MSELEDVIIRDSDKRFRLRIHDYLRSLGVSQIIGTAEDLEIEFIGGDYNLRVIYPQKLDEISEIMKRKLLLETELGIKEIDYISLYRNDHIHEIQNILKEISFL